MLCSFLLSCECLFLCTFGWSVIATFPVFRESAAEQNVQFFIFQSVLVDNWTFTYQVKKVETHVQKCFFS